MIWLGLGLVVLGLVIWPFRREAQLKPMDDSARADAPGQFAKLPRGVTHYRWTGPKDGPVIVCIHGLTTPSYVWDGITPSLAEMGYRVLVYDLYGRGYSDRPGGVQDRTFFLGQLEDLLADQGIDGDLTIMGYSMGGAIAAAFASAEPERVRRVILLAPAGVQTPKIGFLGKVARWPGVGDWLMRLRYPAIHRKGTEAERHLPSAVPGIVDLQQRELTYRGFTPAVLSSFRGMLSGALAPHHRAIAKAGIPVLTVLGEADALIPVTIADTLKEWHPTARVEVIEGAGHGVTYTHADQVMGHIKAFLTS